MQLDEVILQTLERDLGEALENAHHNEGALSADDQYRLIQVCILNGVKQGICLVSTLIIILCLDVHTFFLFPSFRISLLGIIVL